MKLKKIKKMCHLKKLDLFMFILSKKLFLKYTFLKKIHVFECILSVFISHARRFSWFNTCPKF